MEFPVDLLGTVEPEALEHSAKDYMSKLLYRNPEIHESLSLPDSSKVEISLCNVSFVPLYGVDIKQKVLALFSPEDRFKAVGLYLLSQWWSAEDILKTADPSRTGLLEVRTPGERIVLYVLNRIIYRTKEKASDDIHFLCHEEHATAKIFWKSGEAIGFYSVKPEGSLCSSFLTQCYQLPIMDTIFIRKRHRGNGYGLQMLEDFVRSFKKDCLGVKYPLSPAMYKVCKNYLSTYPADKELLWEVEGIGGPFQRTLIAKKLQTMELKGDHQVVGKLNFETESTDVPTEKVMTQVQKTMEYTVEVVEEVVQIKIRKEVQDTPVTTRGRSSNLKRKKLGEDTGATTDKIIRVEDIEAAVQPPVDESMAEVVRSSLNVTEANLKETAVTVTHGEESVMDVTHVQCEEHKELSTESEETVLEVCALTKPITEPATVTPEEALEKTELFQMTPVAEIQSMKCSEETQVVKAFEATVGPVDLQPVELQQVVEVEIVKMTSGIEEVKEKTEEITGTEDGKGEVEEEISEKTVVAATNVVEEARLTCMQKPLQQAELDLKPVIMEESTTTEIRVLRKSSRVSTATPQRKSTRLHNELQVASKPCPSEAKAAPKQRSTQRSKAVKQESAQVVDQPEENPEMRKEAEKEEVVDIVRDANEACSIQSKLTEEADDMNEEVLTEKDTGSPQDAILEGEDMKIDGEKITAEGICQEGKELQNDSEIENREETSSVVELAEVQDSETSEELSEPQKLPDVTGITDEDPEAESVEKEKAGGVEVEKIALHENVVGGAEETEKKNENMEIEEGTVNKNEAGVPRLPVIEKEHMEEVQEEEHMEDTSMVQESVSEKKKEPEVQKPSHDNEVKSENRTELIEEEDAEKASSSHPTGRHDDGQRSNIATPLRRSQRFEDQPSEGELTRRVLRSGTKSVTAISKQKYVRHTKTVKQQEESAQAEGEHEVEQKEEILESHTGVAEGEKMETVRITSVEDNEHVKDDVEEESSLDKEYFKPETSDDHDLKKVEDGSQFENKVDEEDQVTTKDASLEDAETSGDGTKMAVIEFDDTEVVKDAEIEVEGKATLQSVGEPVEEQEEEAREMAQKKEVLKTQSLVEPAEKEQTDSEQLVEMADTVNTVMTEVIDKTETEENSKEKIENKIKAVSKDEDTAPELTDSGQGLTEVVQEEELLKESKPLHEIPGSEELEIEDISKPSHRDEEKKSDNWTEPIEQEDSDKTDNSGSTGKHAASQRSSHKTPLRSSGRFKDQPLEGELTTRVLRSGTKSVTAISKQRHVGHTKAVKQQEEEPATKMAQKEESTSDFTQQKAAVVPPSKQIGDSETAEKTLQSPEEGNQELDKIAGTDENREESKEEEEVVQQTESLVEPAEKAQAGENETSVGSTQSQDGLNNADVAEKEDAFTQMEVEESMTKSLKEQVVKVGAGKMLKTDSEQEESMLTEEKLKDDKVGEITLEEDLGSTAEMCTSDSVQDDQESATAGHEEAVQESSPEEETPIIISRSLRRRTVTVMSPSQRKSKHLRKTEVDKAENEHAVLVEVTHNTDKGIIEEAEENKDEKMEAEDSAVSDDEDRVPKSTETDQGQMEVVQEEELLKVTKTLQEIPSNEETEIKEVSKPSCSDEEQKSDVWTESIAEKDSDKADNSGSTGKHADSQRPNYATPLRRSGRFKDQPVEDELTERVLRSGTKTVTAISKEKSIRHTKTVKSQEESAQAVGEHEVEQNEEAMESHTEAAQREKVDGENSENPTDSLQDESNVEKEYLEAEAIHDHDLKEVENKMEDGLQNETVEDSKKIVAVDLDEAEVVKDAEIDVEEKTGQETGEEQVDEPGTEMAQKEDGENVVESTSDFTQQKAAVVLVEVPPKQTDDTETTEETSQSLEEADQELDKPASAQEDTEESKEEEEVVKQIQCLDEPAENEETGGNQTSTKTSQSPEADWLNKTDALAEMGVEEPMTKELVVVGADKMPKSGSEQEESMLADETLKDDRVGEIELDQESSAAVAHNAAELHTSESEKHQKEDQESKTSGHEETVQGSSSEEETPIIISKSLRRRTVTVMSPPQRKSKHLQKTEVELGENEHVVLVEVTHNTDKGSIEEAEENKDEKMEAEDSAVSDDEDRVPKSTETDQGQRGVVQEEELLKETKTLQDVPGNEGTNNKDVNEPSHGVEEKKSDNWTVPIEQDESINTDNSGSTGKHADGKRSNYSTPLRRSQRFKDQPVESELTKRVLRSGRKTVTAISKQKHVGHTKTVKQQEERAHAVGEPEVGQIEEIMESHTGVAEEEEMETVNATNERDNEKLTALQDRAQEDSGVEKEYLEAEATHDHDLKEVENKMEDDSQNETAEGGKKIVVVDLDDAEVVKDAEIDEKLTQQSGKEPVEEQEEEPATEIVQTEDGQNVVESVSVFTLQEAAVVLVDFSKVPPKQTGDSETLQSPEEGDEERDKLASAEENQEESKEEEEMMKQTELVELAEKEQTGENETSTETTEEEMGVEKLMTERIKECVMEVGADKMLKTAGEQEESMSTEETLKDDRVGEITSEEKSGVAVAESTAEMCTSESEKHQTEHQESVTTGHEEAVQESSPEEETPIITSRSLRRRTVTVISTPQRKSKRLQKAEVEVAENENVQMTEVMEKIDKSSIEEKEENKDEKMETEVSAIPNDEDRIPESPVIDQGQMEVVEGVEQVKETSTPQEVPGNEESTIKELSESDLADKTEVADSYPAEVVKDAETEENKHEKIEAEDSTMSKDEDRVPESTNTDQSRMEVEGPAVEMIPGQGEQKAEEATAGLKLQKASVVLVDFNKVPPKQTTDGVTAKETSWPQEEICQEREAPADIGVYVEESKAEDEGMKQTETQTESAEKEQADEDVVKIAESENVETEDVKSKTAEGTSEIRDNNDEKMETEGDGVKEDEDRVPASIPEKKPVKETSTLQEIPNKAQIQEPSQADEEKSDIQIQEEFSDKAHKADRRKQEDNERPEVGTPVRHSKRFADQPALSELTTRVLRSSTKQVKATPKQRYTRQTKAMMQNEESELTVDKPEEKSKEIKELQTDVAEGEKMETVITEGATENLITAVDGRVEKNNKLEPEQIEESVVAKDIRTETCSEDDKVTTEDEVEEAAEATTDEEKISDSAKDAEMEVEGKTPARSVTEPVEEQAEAPVTEMAQNEDGQNAIKPTSALTLQKATVVLVDFNKVPPIQTDDSETTEETSQSQKEVDKQIDTGEHREESNEYEEEVKLTESLVESAEKEQTVGDEAAQPQNEEGPDKADVFEENEPLAEMAVEEPMTENLEEPDVDMVADNSLKTDNEQEEAVLAEEKLKVGDITLEAESTATVSVCNENQKDDQENITTGPEETVQEGSPEETAVTTSRSLRRRTVTVMSPPQRKSKRVQKPGVQADIGKAEAVKDTDVSEAEKTPAICLPTEVSMPEKEVEDASEHGKVTSETETQECILGEQEIEALVAHEMPEKMLPDEGDAIMKESDDKEKGEMASDTAVSADAKATIIEVEKVLQVKSTEVDHEKDENIDEEMVLLVQDGDAQEKELEIPTGSPTNVVIEATTQAERMVEGEVDSLEKENNQKTSVTKPAQETTEEEVSEEEEEPIMTRNLRSRTVTAKYPMRRKSKRLCQEVAETPVKKAQPEKEAALVEASNERETVEPISAVEVKNEIKITETDSKDESEDAQVASEGTSKEVITLEEQGGENIAETDGEKVKKITDGENDMVEGVPEDKVEERTTEGANNEKVGMEIRIEGSDLIDNDMEKEPDKEEEGNAKPEQENSQEENILDKVEAQLLEEESERESSLVKEKTQIKEPEDKEKSSATEEILDEVEEALSVERRSLRKRTITIKATSERKSKRMRKQDQDETEQVHVYITEDPLSVEQPVMEQADVKSLAEEETTDEEIADDTEKDGETLLEKVQEQENPEGEETCGETNISTEKEKDGPKQAQSRELVNVSEEETDTKTEAQKGEKAEEEGEDKAEADEYKEEAAEHENKITDKGDRTADTVVEEGQEEAEPNEKNGNECNEISLTLDESFTLELEEEDENNGPQENKVEEEMEASLMECLHVASTTIHKTDKCEDQEEEPTSKKRQVLQGRSSAAASPEQRSTRRSKRFLMESQSEMEGRSEVEVAEEEEGKKKPQQKRKAIVDQTPRTSKRLARPKFV